MDADTNNSRLEAVLNNAVDAIITIDERGLVDSANPATEKLFGYQSQELLGKNVSLLMPSPYREEHDGYLENYVDGGPAKIIGIGREVVGRRKDGSIFPMHLAVSEFHDGGRRLFTGIVRDISDLKKAEQQLKQLNEELEKRVQERTAELRTAQAELLKKEKLATLGQVSGGIAHEIRNPLNAVKTSIYYLLNARNPTKEKTVEHLGRIDRQVTLIDNVITALSDVAKLPEPNMKPQDIESILRDVVRATSIEASVDVQFHFPSDLPSVLADEHQIPIVFRNLVRNARDAMREEGQLTIEAKATDGWVAVSVSDTGHGIPEDQLDKILEPLYSTKARGMGLGLAITRTIIDKNKGQLAIESQPGVGSKFTVRLVAATE